MANLITAALLISFAVAIQATTCPAGDVHKYGFTGGCATTAAKFAFPTSTATDANGLIDLLRHKFGAVKIPASIKAVTDLTSIAAGTFASAAADKSIKMEKIATKNAVMDWYPLIYATWPNALAAATKLECGAWHDCNKIQMICVLN